jgi:2-oxoglutarate ferredoxin oxidoreductase subunit alpha
MNNWMSEPFDYPDKPLDRGKVLTAEDLKRLGGFARYKDVDGDAIGYRTLPGTVTPRPPTSPAAPATTTPRLHRAPDDYVGKAWSASRASSKTPASWFPAPTRLKDKSKIGIIAYGTTDFAIAKAGPDQEGIRPRCGLPPHPRLSLRP